MRSEVHITKRILIAGIGNIFLGDDAFGCEVLRELARSALPPEVRAVDFGIRGYDLACALADDYEANILVDATPRGEVPGTVFLIEPDLNALGALPPAAVDAHNLDPVRVLQMAVAMGTRPRQLYLVGCEPEPLESEDGRLGLSESVQAAVPRAVAMVEALANRLLSQNQNIKAGLAPA